MDVNLNQLIKENNELKKIIEELELEIIMLEYEKERLQEYYEDIDEKLDCEVLSWNY